MRNIRRILVAIKDPRAKSLPAVLKAAQLARACGADIELFHGIAATVYADIFSLQNVSLAGIERDMRAQQLRALEMIAVRLRKHGINVTVSAEADFPVYEAIVRRAILIKADLIVAECHAGRRVAPSLLRLTDWELLQLSPLPVLLVKDRRPYRHPVVLAAIDPTHAFSKPTGLDRQILQSSTEIQRALRGTLHAVHAYITLPLYVGNGFVDNFGVAAEIEKTAATRAKKQFEHALKSVHMPAKRRHLMERTAELAIPAVAKKIGSALVVMGAISRSGLKRVFIGNTAERVLDDLLCDVLVVKPKGFKTSVKSEARGLRWVASSASMM